MGAGYTKMSAGSLPTDLAVGRAVTLDGRAFTVAEIGPATGAPLPYEHFYKSEDKIYYLKSAENKSGGAGKKSAPRVKAQPVLYPEEGLHSKWSSPRKRTEKISVDGKAPVNFLSENIGE